MFLEWSHGGGAGVSGSATFTSWTDGKADAATAAFTGTVSDGTVSLTFPQGLGSIDTFTGTLTGSRLTLNFPQSDGTIAQLTLKPGSVADYNADVSSIGAASTAASTSGTDTAQPPTTAYSSTSTASTGGSSGFDFAAAKALAASRGYVIADPHGDETSYPGPLRAFVGVCKGSADGYCQIVFFFVGNKFIGTDTKNGENLVALSWQGGTTTALQYQQYRSGDPMCCPTGGSVTVRFHWTGSQLVALDAIPQPINGQ